MLTRHLAHWRGLSHAYSVCRPGLTLREIATKPNMASGRAWHTTQPPSPRMLRARRRSDSGTSAFSVPGLCSSWRSATGGLRHGTVGPGSPGLRSPSFSSKSSRALPQPIATARAYLSPRKSRAVASASGGVAVTLFPRFVEGRRHRLGLHHELPVVHGRADHELEPRLVVEVEQAPVHDGLREPKSQEEGGELPGPHHAGVLQPRNVTEDLEVFLWELGWGKTR